MTSSREHISFGIEELHVCVCQGFPHYSHCVNSLSSDRFKVETLTLLAFSDDSNLVPRFATSRQI